MADRTLAIQRPSKVLAPLPLARLQAAWNRHSQSILWLAALTMAAAGSGRIAKGFWRLLFDLSHSAAIDLKLFYRGTHLWANGIPVYTTDSAAVLPPAAYPVLWTFIGWADRITTVQWLWAVTSIVALVVLAALVLRESGATKLTERLFLLLLIASASGTGLTIGNGQLGLHVLAFLLAGLLLILERNSWLTDLLGVALLICSLMKPILSVPFMWLVVFVPGRLRPAVLLGLGYAALSLLSASFQPVGLLQFFADWIDNTAISVTTQGYANLHNWLHALSLDAWMLPSSLAALIALGAYIFFNRRADPWRLIGVAALVARLWTYHFVYDDVLILLPMVTLFREAKRGQAVAGLLLAIATAAAVAPARLINLGWPLATLYEAGQTIIWVAMLVFLIAPAQPIHERLPEKSFA